jgi:hypothetical protein
LIDAIEPLIHAIEPLIDAIEPLIDAIESLIDAVEPLIDAVEPLIDAVEPPIDLTEPTVETLEKVLGLAVGHPLVLSGHADGDSSTSTPCRRQGSSVSEKTHLRGRAAVFDNRSGGA